MTTGEMIEILKTVPPETPVVRLRDLRRGWRNADARQIEVFHTGHGFYCQFKDDALRCRNNTIVVEVY